MRCKHLLLLLNVWLPCAAPLLAQQPEAEGYITRLDSGTLIHVNGVAIQLTPQTAVTLVRGKPGQSAPTPYLGEYAVVVGTTDTHTRVVTAQRLTLSNLAGRRVSGMGIIDLIPPPGATNRFVRADGRLLQLPELDPQTNTKKPKSSQPQDPPRVSLDDLRTNVWIDYHGVEAPDGTIVVSTADFFDNAIDPTESKLIARLKFDSSAITESDRQSSTARFFVGTNFKRIPALHDEALQARIDRIGTSLIPAYQKALPLTDATRIDFHFQLVDEPKWHDAVTLPSGIILVPRRIVQLLTDDSQLATVLADNIATALEKQDFRQQKTMKHLKVADYTGLAAGLVIPGAGIATAIATNSKRSSMLSAAEQQSGRVSLCLLHDAGYDITVAPEAWWTLAAKPGQDAHLKDPPPRAANLFDTLGTTWRTTLTPNPQQASAKVP